MNYCRKTNLFFFSEGRQFFSFLEGLTFVVVGGGGKTFCKPLLSYNTSVSARWHMPYAVEENLRGMNERMKEWMKDRHSGFLILNFEYKIMNNFRRSKYLQKIPGIFRNPTKIFNANPAFTIIIAILRRCLYNLQFLPSSASTST